MTSNPIGRVAGATIDTAKRELLDRDIGRLIVVDRDDRIVGVVSRRDVRRPGDHRREPSSRADDPFDGARCCEGVGGVRIWRWLEMRDVRRTGGGPMAYTGAAPAHRLGWEAP
jgi:hypothetical protein